MMYFNWYFLIFNKYVQISIKHHRFINVLCQGKQ